MSDKAFGRKRRGALISVLFTAALIAASALIIVFDIGGARTRTIPGIARKIPIIGNMLSPESQEERELSPEEASARIAGLEAEILKYKEEIETLNGKTDIYVDEITNLRARLDAAMAKEPELDARAAEFDERIAMGDPAAYADFYERINPQTAESLYPKAAAERDASKAARDYVAAFAGMDEASAARILDRLTDTEMDLVTKILLGMNAAARGAVMAEMDPDNAAAAAKFMSPD
jgi:flagellar motility protein MotE (MotC chaperone)